MTGVDRHLGQVCLCPLLECCHNEDTDEGDRWRVVPSNFVCGSGTHAHSGSPVSGYTRPWEPGDESWREDRKPPGIRLSRRYAIRVLIATWVLAIATAILALSGPVALFAWLNARKQDRDRRQREHEQEMEDRILKNAGDRFVPKSQVAGVATLGALGAVITFLAWLDAKKPKA